MKYDLESLPFKKEYTSESINITHEFPLQFYLDGFAKKTTAYDYCLIHRYLDNVEYRNYMKSSVKEGRVVYLDNSLYELGSAWDLSEYAKVIEELNPTYYMLPDVFTKFEKNINSQLNFYKKYSYLESKPIIIPHASKLEGENSLIESIRILKNELPDAMIAIPFGDISFINDSGEEDYVERTSTSYIPLIQACNRRIFLMKHYKELLTSKIHLLGCKSLGEFVSCAFEGETPTPLGSGFDKFNIVSLDTSHPVAFTLENPYHRYTDKRLFEVSKDTKGKIIMHYYKSPYLIDEHFTDYFSSLVYDDLIENIITFQQDVEIWWNFR